MQEQINLWQIALDLAREKGAVYPQIGECSSGEPVIVNTDNGDCYYVEIKVRKIFHTALTDRTVV